MTNNDELEWNEFNKWLTDNIMPHIQNLEAREITRIRSISWRAWMARSKQE